MRGLWFLLTLPLLAATAGPPLRAQSAAPPATGLLHGDLVHLPPGTKWRKFENGEPGFLPPSVYVAAARRAIYERFGDRLRAYDFSSVQDPIIVTINTKPPTEMVRVLLHRHSDTQPKPLETSLAFGGYTYIRPMFVAATLKKDLSRTYLSFSVAAR